jgi:hypothetical protein
MLMCAAVLFPWIAFKLRFRGLSAFAAPRRAVSLRSNDIDPARVALLVNALARRRPFRSSCLTRSIVLMTLLQRRGITTELRIGVCRVGQSVDAHAWIEHNGVPLNDQATAAQTFLPFDAPIPLQAFRAR